MVVDDFRVLLDFYAASSDWRSLSTRRASPAWSSRQRLEPGDLLPPTTYAHLFHADLDALADRLDANKPVLEEVTSQ